MKCFVVTEGRHDAVLLDRVLSSALSRDGYEVMSAGGRSAAVSLARSLLVTRPNPVALVVDADAHSPAEAEARRQRILYEIGEVADLSRVLVVVVVPETEALLFSDEGVVRQLLGRDPDPREMDDFRNRPKESLANLLTGRDTRTVDPDKLRGLLDRLDLSTLSSDGHVAPLVEFISSSAKLAGAGF